MKILTRILFVGAFMLLALASTALAQRVYIDINQPVAKKIAIAAPDFQPMAPGSPSPEEVAQALPRRLAHNLDLTGLFIPLDKKTFLEADPRAGLGQGSEINPREWTAIGAEFVVKGGFDLAGQQLQMELRLYDVIDGKMILGKRYTGGVGDGKKMVNRFCNEILLLITGEPGVFGTKIAFVQGVRSNKRVFLAEFGGDEVVQVSTGSGPSNMPTVSPSGSVAYVCREGTHYQLKVGSQVVASGPLYLSPTFAPDGWLYASVSGSTDTNIFKFGAPGSQPVKITDSFGINISPTFSPDGARMAFVSDRAGGAQVYISSSGGGPAQRLTTQGGENTDPAWSPRGDKIAFCTDSKNICVINPDGSGLQQLTTGGGQNTRPSWSPDGRLLAFASTRQGTSKIFIMTVNGQGQRPMMPDYQGDQREPYWSPVKPTAGQ